MVSVGMLRASGFLDLAAELLGSPGGLDSYAGAAGSIGISPPLSSSAATSLVLDIYKSYGTDSVTGMTASIMMGCTETVFYTMSVYFLTAKVSKTRWTLAGALFATAAGIAASVVLARLV